MPHVARLRVCAFVKALTSAEQTREREANALLAQLNGLLTRESQRPQPDQARVADLKNKLQQARPDHEAFTNNLYAAGLRNGARARGRGRRRHRPDLGLVRRRVPAHRRQPVESRRG